MNENNELLVYIYKNAEMGTLSCTNLIRELNGKDNKIKKAVEDILKEYEKYQEDSENLIDKYSYEIEENSKMTKMGSKMGIKMEVIKDNSDSAIAKMLIEGLTMGVVDISSKIERYKSSADKKIIKLAKDYLRFQEDAIEELKVYL